MAVLVIYTITISMHVISADIRRYSPLDSKNSAFPSPLKASGVGGQRDGDGVNIPASGKWRHPTAIVAYTAFFLPHPSVFYRPSAELPPPILPPSLPVVNRLKSGPGVIMERPRGDVSRRRDDVGAK